MTIDDVLAFLSDNGVREIKRVVDHDTVAWVITETYGGQTTYVESQDKPPCEVCGGPNGPECEECASRCTGTMTLDGVYTPGPCQP